MSQANVLTLECTPADSPDLAQWSLHFNQRTASGRLPAVLDNQQRTDFQWYLEKYLTYPFEGFVIRAAKVEADLVTVGKALFAAIFKSSVSAAEIYAEWMQVDAGAPTLQILSIIPAVLSVPWELLHDDFGFLCQRRQNPVAIYRIAKTIPSTILKHQFTLPLRVLMIVARPDDQNFLDPRSSAQTIFSQLQHLEQTKKTKSGMIELEFLRPPTYDQLARRLQDTNNPVHILHFDGHGGFPNIQPTSTLYQSANPPQGVLSFEKADYQVDAVKASRFAELLNGAGVRLVLLDACQTSVMDTSESDNDAEYQRQQALSSVATQLLAVGVPAVVAMSASVWPITTAIFFGELYSRIAKGEAVPLALERARQALQSNNERLFLASSPDNEAQSISLTDWWLPHFYQQAAINLTPTGKPPRPKPTKLSGFVENQHQRPFVGRAKELLQLERALLKGKITLLYGFGGIGKTRLASEAAAWLTQTKLYHGALLLSFEHGGNQMALLSAIARHYELSETDSHDLNAALKRFKPYLRNKPLLIIADNLESILPNDGNNAPNVLDAQERQALWDCVLGLRQAGAGIILTCRDYDLRDSRLQQDQLTNVIEMRGLDAHAAYSFATALLDDLAINRRRAPTMQLKSLLVRLDHHPLAMNLTLRALRNPALSIEQLLSDYSSVLAQCTDETSLTQRHSSLEASLNYSLQRLSPAQRDWLARLTPFEGGVFEENLLAITDMPPEQWSQLRAALAHAGLIQAESLGKTVVFLHFHPTLSPYLRRQYPTPTELEQRFARRYYDFSRYCYQEDRQNPQEARVLVRYELPNLQRAIQQLLANQELNIAVQIADILNQFYDRFGMQRERQLLNQQLAPYLVGSHQCSIVEFLHETELGEAEYRQGHYAAALDRFSHLLNQIEQYPADPRIGLGSDQHCLTLMQIGRCLQGLSQLVQAKAYYQQALMVIDQLLRYQEDRCYLKQKAILLTDLATINAEQGLFADAQICYQQANQLFAGVEDLSTRAVNLAQLASLALQQRNYRDANQKYHTALAIYQGLADQRNEAGTYYQLGRIAHEQADWAMAEDFYRQSLIISERLYDSFMVAQICNQLALVAALADRPIEAEGWYYRALQVVDVPPLNRALWLNNLANLLATEIQKEKGVWDASRLAEAQTYAEQALAIKQTLDPSSAEIWTTFGVHAQIADLGGHPEQAARYWQQARIAYAAHETNRYHINQQFGQLIEAIVAAAKGNPEAHTLVAQGLPQLESNGWTISTVVQRIWAGERDWYVLCTEIEHPPIALLILRVLEELKKDGG